MLDHPNSRGLGFLVTPAEASAGRVQYGVIELTRASIERQPEAFQHIVISEVMIKKSLEWMHDCVYYLTFTYEWDLGKIDKEGFIPIKFVVYLLGSCWEKQSAEQADFNVLLPNRELLALCLLVENSGDFEQWASIPPIRWGQFFYRIHVDIAKGNRSVLDVNLREPDVQPLVREMLFDMSWVTHLRNKKRHCLRLFGRAIQ